MYQKQGEGGMALQEMSAVESRKVQEKSIHCCTKLQKVYFNFELREAFGTVLTPVINNQKPWVERKQVCACV